MQYPHAATAPERACAHNLVVRRSISFSPKIISSQNRQSAINFNSSKFRSALRSSGLRSMSVSRRANHSAIRASSTSSSSSSSFSSSSSPWNEKPYQVLSNGKIVYLDEQDVVTFLDPPKELIPLDPSSYNPASYLWKKIEDIPEERRHTLLSLIIPRESATEKFPRDEYADPKNDEDIKYDYLGDEDDVDYLKTKIM